MASNIKKNFFYSSILTGANYFFPLIIYPYISRVLGVNNIGLVNFIDSIINYFILFSTMGVGIFGIREIARVKNNEEELSRVYSSLFSLTAIMTIIMLILLIVVTIFIEQLHEHSQLMYIGSMKLIGNLFLVEWFYKGIENFKFITIRSISIKTFYVIAIFIFVKQPNDTQLYYLFTSISVIINAIVNSTFLRKFTHINFKSLQIKPFIKPFFVLGLYSLLTSMYTTFNITYLGFISGDTEVGYYTTATKVYSILLAIYTAFTGVLIPRMSQLAKNGNMDSFREMIKKSFEILFAFIIPFIAIIEVVVPQLIDIISGPGYEGAINPMHIIVPIMFIIGCEQILVFQGLMPLKKDKIIFINSLVGAIVGIALNIILVPHFGALGSSIVWFSCEFLILILSQIAISKNINMSFPFSCLLKNIYIILPIIIMGISLKKIITNDIILVVCCFSIVILLCLIYQVFFLKDGWISKYIRGLANRFIS